MAGDDQTADDSTPSGNTETAAPSSNRAGKSRTAFRTISEVADELDVAQHVLRFWESKFSQVRPLKRGGGRRYYRPEDVELLREIRVMLYDQGYTIKGAQKLLRTSRSKPKIRQQSLDLAETPRSEPGAPVSALHELRSHLVAVRDRAVTAFGS